MVPLRRIVGVEPFEQANKEVAHGRTRCGRPAPILPRTRSAGDTFANTAARNTDRAD